MTSRAKESKQRVGDGYVSMSLTPLSERIREGWNPTYEQAEALYGQGGFTPAEWEAWQYVWANSAPRFSSLGDVSEPRKPSVKKYVTLIAQAYEHQAKINRLTGGND